MSTYDFRAIEAEAQAYWQAYKVFSVKEDSKLETFYCLSMLPYPSGKLHMGHVRNYTIGDVITRFQRMQGKNVLQPIGWDAFGLPAENAAIDNNQHPAKWTYANIDLMRRQLQGLGFAYDWEREFATCTPEYYRWEQLLFIKMYEAGLAYRQENFVNWDPVEQTVLANEQVEDGCGWRSKAPVERRLMPQWYMRISAYAEELLNGLDQLQDWPQSVLTQQRNWIGKSEGAYIRFPLVDAEGSIEVFTTRADTICGVSFLALAAEHQLAQQQAQRNPQVAEFVKACARAAAGGEAAQATVEKQGIDSGLQAINPITGETITVWVANYVLMEYGCGAVMGVPAHDQRDYDFAATYGFAVKPVIAAPDSEPAASADADSEPQAYTGYGKLINSGVYDGMDFEPAVAAIGAELERKQLGRLASTYRLRDWGVSRQRYWGCPVPMIHCPSCGIVPVPEDQLPVVLPENVAIDGRGKALDKVSEFVEVQCPNCGGNARRDTDTFDTFVESSWYYARYCCSDQNQAMLDARARYWLPVNQYIGGVEHAVLHLLYARFFHRVMRDLLRDKHGEALVTSDEPFPRLLAQGMLLAEVYYRDDAGHPIYFAPDELEFSRDHQQETQARSKADGLPVAIGRRKKMSKSSKNGVDPEAIVARYGADAVRLYMMFTSPPQQAFEWTQEGLDGSARFLRRFYRLCREAIAASDSDAYQLAQLGAAGKALWRKLNQSIAKISDDIARRYTFNTAIAAVMELMNALSNFAPTDANDRALARAVASQAILLLAPVTPHLCHHLWNSLGADLPLQDARYPVADPDALSAPSYQLAVQVNGKLRATLSLARGSAAELVQEQAAAAVSKYLQGAQPRKVVHVPERIVNFVI